MFKPYCNTKRVIRVYVCEEEGAKLVRHGRPVSTLTKALSLVARFAPAIYWEIREFKNGVEKLINVETVTLP